MTRILMVGAGGIGGYFGARMVQNGADVTFLVRPRRAAQIAEGGLVVRSVHGDAVLPVRTVTADALGGGFDAVVLSCKAYDLVDAIASFAPAVGPGTRILPLLNGMRHMDVLADRFGTEAVLGGQCQIAATLEADGTVRQLGDMQALSLGRPDGAPDPVAEALAAATAPQGGRVSATIVQDMWEKWVFITTLACTTCLLRGAVGDVTAAGAGEVPRALLAECAAIAAFNGHALRPAATARFGAMVSGKAMLTASMLRDVEAGHRTEVEHVAVDLLDRGEPGASPMLRLAVLHLRTYEARRARGALPARVPA